MCPDRSVFVVFRVFACVLFGYCGFLNVLSGCCVLSFSGESVCSLSRWVLGSFRIVSDVRDVRILGTFRIMSDVRGVRIFWVGRERFFEATEDLAVIAVVVTVGYVS